MLSRLQRFIAGLEAGGESVRPAPRDELAMAAAVLLTRAAVLDGGVDDRERAVAADRLVERFGVPRDEIEAVMAQAAQTADEAVDLYGFTRVLKSRLDADGRLMLMETLWEVVYADGTLHDYNAQFMRRLTGLLFVADRDSGEARKRALVKLGLDATGASD